VTAAASAAAAAADDSEMTASPAPAGVVVVPVVVSLTVQVGGSRYCHRVGRHHRGNHVYYTVDLDGGAGHGTAWQACHDSECRGFRSPPIAVPGEVLPEQVPEGAALVLE
jgi:hypothetical protein